MRTGSLQYPLIPLALTLLLTACFDADGDGVFTEDNCDDSHPGSPSKLQDPECDGLFLSDNGVTVH